MLAIQTDHRIGQEDLGQPLAHTSQLKPEHWPLGGEGKRLGESQSWLGGDQGRKKCQYMVADFLALGGCPSKTLNTINGN